MRIKLLLLSLLATILVNSNYHSQTCSRTYQELSRPFVFDSYYGTESGNVWHAGGSGEIAVQFPTKEAKVFKLETEEDFYSIFFVDEDYGWVVGVSGTIFHTRDGGLRWLKQESGQKADLQAIYCVDRSACWIVGDNGTIMSTNDGGTKWKSYIQKEDADLYALSFTNTNTGWAVGRKGTVLRTINGGKSWKQFKVNSLFNKGIAPIDLPLFSSVKFFDSKTGCIISDGNLLLCTNNGGLTWSKTVTDAIKFVGLVLENDHIVAVGQCPIDDFVSFDHGKSWIRKQSKEASWPKKDKPV